MFIESAKLGLVYRRRRRETSALRESSEILAWRGKYLGIIKMIRTETPSKPIIYLDETWLNEGYSKEFGWEDTEALEKTPKVY